MQFAGASHAFRCHLNLTTALRGGYCGSLLLTKTLVAHRDDVIHPRQLSWKEGGRQNSGLELRDSASACVPSHRCGQVHENHICMEDVSKEFGGTEVAETTPTGKL